MSDQLLLQVISANFRYLVIGLLICLLVSVIVWLMLHVGGPLHRKDLLERVLDALFL